MKLPSGMTTAQLRAHVESEIAKGVSESGVLVAPASKPLMKKSWLELANAAERVLKHEPKPDMTKSPS